MPCAASYASMRHQQSGQATHTKALCLTKKRPCLTVRLVLLLRSCVVLVTVAVSEPLESVSIRMRFLDSCSWHRITFSVPCRTQYSHRFKKIDPSRLVMLTAAETSGGLENLWGV